MKRILTILILLSICQYISPQNYNNVSANSPSSGRESILAVSPTVLFETPNGRQMAGGLKIQVFLGGRLSIDGDIVFSSNYAHFSPSIIGVPLALLLLNKKGERRFGELLLTIAALALSFEHVSYHIPVFNNFDITPYVSLLRYKFAYKNGDNPDPNFIGEQLCFTSGLQLDKYIGRFVFSPYAEYCFGYKDHLSGYNLGVYLGVYFGSPGPKPYDR